MSGPQDDPHRKLTLDEIAAQLGSGQVPVPPVPEPPAPPQGANGHRAPQALVPLYPADQLTGPLAGLVTSSGLPDPLLGAGGLAVLASLCGNAEVELPGGDTERPALWVAAIAPSGGAKSPSLERRAMAPLHALEAAAREQWQRDLAEWKRDPGQRERPPDPGLVIEDITIEAVARLLSRRQQYGGCGLAYADELDAFLSSIGQYKRGASGDLAKWIQSWNARSLRVQRVGQARGEDLGVDIYVPRTCLSILGGLQPHLHGKLGDDASGMRARWLPHLSGQQSVPWDGWTPDGRAEWTAAITRMHAAKTIRRRWELSENAKAAWREAQARWKARDGAELNATVRAALKKADIQAARIALVLAESAREQPPVLAGRGVIDGASMRSAVAITDYCLDVFRVLPGTVTYALTWRDEKLAAKVEELRDWLEARPGHKATVREILTGHAAGVRTAAQRKELLRAYDEAYPRRWRHEVIAYNETTVVYGYELSPEIPPGETFQTRGS